MPYADHKVQREYQRIWKNRRREEWFSGKVCADCGTTENLELDHIDPTNKVSHRIWTWRAEKREAELTKCEPRCSGCHQIKTSRQRHEQALLDKPCGTDMAYRRGCRCDACKQAKSIENAKRVRA